MPAPPLPFEPDPRPDVVAAGRAVNGPGDGPQPGSTARVTLGAGAAGQRLDRALAAALPGLSRSRLQALIAGGFVACGGSPVRDAAARVRAGEVYEVAVPPPEPARLAAQAMDLAVVFENEALLVIDKPAGLVVHPGPGNPGGTLVNALLAHCGDSLSGIGGEIRPGIVHRLDKDTSGLIAVAKTDAAHAALSAQLADRSMSRTYLAVVRGVPSPSRGTVDRPIGRSPHDRQRMAVVARGGRAAVTHYRLVRPLGSEASLVECRLETGRTHQIRVHMASIGHGVAGDPVYSRPPAGRSEAAQRLRAFPRQALHAAELALTDPLSGRRLTFESTLPADISTLITSLESF